MEDYYVHLRNGYIVPTQNATEHNTMRTKEQLDQYTDLFILPNASNSAEAQLLNKTVSAAAVGFLYFDDGVSYAKNLSIFDFYYQYGGSGTGREETVATIFFEQSGNGYKDANGAANEKIGTITVFNPMMDAVSDHSVDPPVLARKVASVQASVVDLSTGQMSTVDLEPTYALSDSDSQVLQFAVASGSSADARHYRFEEVEKIVITYEE